MTPEPNTGCHLWFGSIQGRGYGTVRVNGKMQLAHRVEFERVNGPIPVGMQIDHLCRQRSCVNPRHMEVVTGPVNTRRGRAPTTLLSVSGICKRGHPLVVGNVYRNRSSRLGQCRTCVLASKRGDL